MAKKRTLVKATIDPRPGFVCFNVSVRLDVDKMTKELSEEQIRGIFRGIAEGLIQILQK